MPAVPPPTLSYEHPQELPLERGGALPGFRLAYETWGTLNARRDNAVVILHALSGSSHAAPSALNKAPGWWDALFTEGSPLHPRRHFIVCANLLGGCYGSTGPGSIDPRTSKRYNLDFPQITIGDMVEAFRKLIAALGIDAPVILIGGSMGGMLVLQWAVDHPAEVSHAISLVSPGRSYAQTIALRSVQRDAIRNDPAWNQGDYHDGPFPALGLSLARRIGVITYRSAAEFETRFGRREMDPRPHFNEGFFDVQSYLDHQGKKFVARFDPNTYLYYSRAMDLYDLSRGYPSLDAAAARVTARTLLVAVDSDFLCPIEQVQEVEEALARSGADSRLVVLRSLHGHDAFLIEGEQIRSRLDEFLVDRQG
jgi:homoserine O-acetyltransferase